MRSFTYVKAPTEERAIDAALTASARYIAGGTTLVDLMRLDVENPRTLVDITALPLAGVEQGGDHVRIGALARNSDVAHHPIIASRFPALSQALLSGASPQLRNMATVGGNLLQRTRCSYFRDPSAACNKRSPGAGCSAWDGYNRAHAILGGGPSCIATHASDMCVALVALDAVVEARGPGGGRSISVGDFHLVPGDRPDIETVLRPGELVTHVVIPATPLAARSTYVKVRDRASYAFALVSAAVGLDIADDTIRAARVALGGVATKPWRSAEAEQILLGKTPSVEVYRAAAASAVREAAPRPHNAFKIELVQRTLVRALGLVGGLR
jgi:xanthine dehydrogenase YagS FAD-binding subunit